MVDSVQEAVLSKDLVSVMVSVIRDGTKKQVVVSVKLLELSTTTSGCFCGSVVTLLLVMVSLVLSSISVSEKFVENFVSDDKSVDFKLAEL